MQYATHLQYITAYPGAYGLHPSEFLTQHGAFTRRQMGHHTGPLTGRCGRPKSLDDAGTQLQRTHTFGTAPCWAIEVTTHRDGACRTEVRLGGLQASTGGDACDRDVVCRDSITTECIGQEVAVNRHDLIV